MKQSETITIKRSQISLNPCNPKRHTDAQIAQQKKNLKKVGYLGGIVYNALSGNLVDGHRRVQALDLINKYDGTSETDYDIKVEKVEFDDKTEKEQLTYMAIGNSKADYNLIAEYIDQIDYGEVGMTDEEYESILSLSKDIETDAGIPDMADMFVRPVESLNVREKSLDEIQTEHENKPKMTKEQVKAEKRFCDNVASDRQTDMDSYIVIKFSNMDEKQAFCDIVGMVEESNMTIDGIKLLEILDK